MSTEDDLHFALCIIKIFALLVIASSLWTISSSPSCRGYATDGFKGREFSVMPGPNDSSSPTYLGPGYNSETSQAYFGNRFEPPVFWNAGDMATISADQQASVSAGQIAGSYDATLPAAAVASSHPATGAFRGYMGVHPKKGYAVGVNTKGYATNLLPNY